MSGLNFLLWTIAVILILGVVAYVVGVIYICRVRNKVAKEIGNRSGLMSRLKEAQAEQEALQASASARIYLSTASVSECEDWTRTTV